MDADEYYSILRTNALEMDFALSEYDNTVYWNAEYSVGFRMERFGKMWEKPPKNHWVRLHLVYPYNEYGWVRKHTGGVVTVYLTNGCVEEFKEWLSSTDFPVDAIIRRRRLRALLA